MKRSGMNFCAEGVRLGPAFLVGLLFLTAGVAVRGDVRDLFEDVRREASEGWHVSVDSVFLSRSDDMATVLFRDTFTNAVILHTGQLDMGTAAGPVVSIKRDLAEGWGVGFRFFDLDGWDNAFRYTSGTDMRESFNGMAYSDIDQFDILSTSRLTNVELNLEKEVAAGLVVLAGYRFLELDERFRIDARNAIPQVPAIEISDTQTSSQLHGLQFGLRGTLLEFQRLRLEAGGTAGLYGNHVSQQVFIRNSTNNLPPYSTRSDEAAFVGDLNVTGLYRLTSHLSLRGGFQMLWLSGVALAPNQTQNNTAFGARGIDNESSVFYCGGFAGLQLDF